MKSNLLSLFCLLSVICPVRIVAGWTNTHGPFGHNIRATCLDSSGNVYAATIDNGIYVSPDNGVSWNQENSGLSTYVNIYSLVCTSKGHVLAGTFDATIFRTTDNGIHWNVCTKGDHYRVWSMATNSNGTVFAGLEWTDEQSPKAGTMISSTDDGLSWTTVSGYGCVYSIAFDAFNAIHTAGSLSGYSIPNEKPNDITPPSGSYVFICQSGDMLYATLSGVAHSTNLGITWLDNSLPDQRIVSFGQNKYGVVFAGSTSGHVWKSQDNGSTWENDSGISAKGTITSFTFGVNGTTFVSTAGDGIFHSSDYGKTWMPGGLSVSVQLACTPSGDVYAARDDGVVSILSPNLRWHQFRAGTSAVAGSDSTLFVAAGCLYKYVGVNDTGISNCLNYSPQCYMPASSGTAAITRLDAMNKSVLYGSGRAVGVYPTYDYRGRLMGYQEESSGIIVASKDAGLSWKKICEVGCNYPQRVFAGTGGMVIIETGNQCASLVSTNFGTTWSNLSDSCYLSVASTSTNVIYKVGSDGVVKRSADVGTHWDVALNLASKQSSATSVLIGPNDFVVVGTSTQGVYYSRDGDSWKFMGSELPTLPVGAMAIDSSGRLYVSLTNGVWRSDSSITTVSESAPVNIPSTSALDIYPNPASESPMMSVVLDTRENVSAELSDPLGRVTVVCRNESRPAGTSTLRIPTDNLSNGLYLCRVHAGSHTFTKSVVVNR